LVKRIESLADALAKLNGALDPLSEAYHARNPGMLLAFNPRHERNANGRRIFSSFTGGYDNLLLDLSIKCTGKSRAKLGPESPLVDLLHVYGHSTSTLRYVIRYLRHALKDEMIPNEVKLGWFVEEEKTDA
jgi:hypothetical protein